MANNIEAKTFQFLQNLKQNNSKDWFLANKKEYENAYENAYVFANDLIQRMNTIDEIETPNGKKAIFRIYKDVRFSKDKTPYKTHIGGHLTRATKLRRGGFYFHIEPENSFVGGGFWNPNPEDLKRIREHISYEPERLQTILNSNSFKSNFVSLKGEKLKTAPKGFDKNDPAIDLINFKQFLISKPFTDSDVLSDNYLDEVFNTFKAMLPFFDYMSEILTTDLNGEQII